MGGDRLTLDDLLTLEAHAASEFFRELRGLDARGAWRERKLGKARAKLEKWMAARGNRKEREDD